MTRTSARPTAAAPRRKRRFHPAFDGQVCSLGYQVIDWIEAYCCHGKGDLLGDPVTLDDEWFDFVVAAYELDPVTGRRRKDRVLLSRSKGRAKSELAGLVGVAEALGPVRFDGWDAAGQPVGRPVRSPLIKCLATEEEQAGNTFEVIAFVAGQWGPDTHPDVFGGVSGARRYQSATALYLPRGGEIRACTSGAASKDGGLETFVVPDEVHLYVLPELRDMYATVARNCGKREIAQPWMLLTTTMYAPGEQSVAEAVMTAWRTKSLPNADRWLIDHREAKGPIRIRDREHTLAQLTDVYGAAAGWVGVEAKYRSMLDPTECPDDATAARYFLNRAVSGDGAWIDADVARRQVRHEAVPKGTPVALGFDGSLNFDATALVATRLSDRFSWPIGIWGPPPGRQAGTWQVPRDEVLAAIRQAFADFEVARMYADPHEWRSDLNTLAEDLGAERVLTWETRRDVPMAAALDRLHTDLMLGTAWHSGDPLLVEHTLNAYVRHRGRHRLVRKEHDRSLRKIDALVAWALAYEAAADAVAAGYGQQTSYRAVSFR